MSVNQLKIIILFDQILFIGKVSKIIRQIDPRLNIEKFFDLQQLEAFNFDNESDYILITEYNFLSQMQDKKLDLKIFKKIYSIDEVVMSLNYEHFFINKNKVIIELINNVESFIQYYLNQQAYTPIHIDQLKIGKEYRCNFYIKLNNHKYVKILEEDQILEQSFIDEQKSKKLTHLFVKENDYRKVQQRKSIITNIDFSQEKIDALEALHKYTRDLGIDEKVINKAQGLLKSLNDDMKKTKLKGLINKLINLEGSYIYNHSFFCACLIISVGRKFSWFSYENQKKMFMACMLHDLGILNEEFALFENKDLSKLSDQKKIELLSHTEDYAIKLEQTQILHQDVINMIKYHHAAGENPYPKAIPENKINLLYALFILGHEFSHLYFKCLFNQSKVPAILEQMQDQYTHKSFVSIFSEFKSVVLETFSTN